MTDNRVWKLPESAPDPAELAAAWTQVVENGVAAMQAGARPAPSARLRSDRAGARDGRFHRPALVQPDGGAAGEPGRRVRMDGAVGRRRPPRRRPARSSRSIAPERGDRRFGDPAWSEEPVFDYLKQAYLLASAPGDRPGRRRPRG